MLSRSNESLWCRHCSGAGLFATRYDLQGRILDVESCDRCFGRGVKPCLLCEEPATELDADHNPLCAACGAHERALESLTCPCGGRVVAIVDGRGQCDRCLTAERDTPEDEAIDRHLEAWKEMRAEARRAS